MRGRSPAADAPAQDHVRDTIIGTLAVPGASLFHKVRGAGPVLLILQGGADDADGSHVLAEELAERYTVVTHDRRGLSRSVRDDLQAPMSVRTHSDDASHLLTAMTDRPAFVFGSSFGAVIGLDLAATHPDQVRVLVAHEATVAGLLADPERSELEAAQRAVEETFERDGLKPAVQRIRAITGGAPGGGRRRRVAGEPSASARTATHLANLRFFFGHDIQAAHRYELDVGALRAVTTRIVPAAGRTSRDALPHRCAEALAWLLGRELVEFPGDHTGYVRQPRRFARALDTVLRAVDTER